MKKKVLIITYYWPPSGGPGVQRILKFAKYLPNFGWEPVILTVKDGEYPETDESLMKDIRSDLKVYRVPTIEFFNLFKIISGKKKSGKIATYELLKDKKNLSPIGRLAQYIRINFFIPDARVGWTLTGVKAGIKIAKIEKPDLILSSSPPHSLQLIAYRLSRKLQLPWIADFRDPWTKAFNDKAITRLSLAEKINKNLELKVVQNADAVISVSNGFLELLPLRANSYTKVIPNGYDSADFIITKSVNKKFQITYTGFMAATQNPENLWKAIAGLKKKHQELIEVHLYGFIDSSVQKSIQDYKVGHLVKFHNYVNHDQVINLIINSDLLILVIPRYHGKGIQTGKLYEYMASGNYTLGFGDPQSEVANTIKECGAGDMISYDGDPSDLIIKQIQRWQEGIQHQPDFQKIARFERKNITRRLAQVFNEVIEQKDVYIPESNEDDILSP